MPPRNTVPPVLAGRDRQIVDRFWQAYRNATEHEKSLPKEQRFISSIGPTYAAIGYVLYRDFQHRKRSV